MESEAVSELSALILAGGTGTRFWPASRRARPKQLLSLVGGASLLRETLRRVEGLMPSSRCFISTTRALAEAVAAELPELARANVIAEPQGRNTAPAIAWALAKMPASLDRQPVVVLPSDHHVADVAAFCSSLSAAARIAATERCLVTLGVPPERPETGYGYLELERRFSSDNAGERVVRFVEKPDAVTARRFFAGGRHVWNAGIFVFLPEVFFERLELHQPEIWSAARRVRSGLLDESGETALYGSLPSVSIDYGLMEHVSDTRAVPLECGWSDLGSWRALERALLADDTNNCTAGDVVAIESSDNVVVTDAGVIALLGVDGMVVVRSGDAVLVAPKERSQEVRRIVEELEARGRCQFL